MKTLIKNGRVVTAVDDYRADIFIDGETVTTIDKTLDAVDRRESTKQGRKAISRLP